MVTDILFVNSIHQVGWNWEKIQLHSERFLRINFHTSLCNVHTNWIDRNFPLGFLMQRLNFVKASKARFVRSKFTFPWWLYHPLSPSLDNRISFHAIFRYWKPFHWIPPEIPLKCYIDRCWIFSNKRMKSEYKERKNCRWRIGKIGKQLYTIWKCVVEISVKFTCKIAAKNDWNSISVRVTWWVIGRTVIFAAINQCQSEAMFGNKFISVEPKKEQKKDEQKSFIHSPSFKRWGFEAIAVCFCHWTIRAQWICNDVIIYQKPVNMSAMFQSY